MPIERIQDPYGIPLWPVFKGRDGCRTPMVWNKEAHGGFSTTEPWLPVDERHLKLSVAEQESDSASLLNKVRQLIKWRQTQPELLNGELEQVAVDNQDLIAYVREYEGKKILVVINMTQEDHTAQLPMPVKAVAEGHGFVASLDGQVLNLPAYQAFYARID